MSIGKSPNIAHLICRCGSDEKTVAKLLALHGGLSKMDAAVRKDPYDCLRTHVSIDVVDRIAITLKFPVSKRVAGTARWMLMDSYKNGHTCARVNFALTKLRFDMQLPPPTLERALEKAVEGGTLVRLRDSRLGDVIQTREQYDLENSVAIEVARRVRERHVLPLTPPTDATLSMISSSLLCIVTGAAGTGKTTTIRSLIENNPKLTIRVTAPTGRAARNTNGRTVHYFKTIQESGKNEFLGADIVVVDEASMLTADLFSAVLQMAPRECHIVLVGDANQLPPVGPGDVFRDLLDTTSCPAQYLTTNYRNPNGIDVFARGILDGVISFPDDERVVLIECETIDDTLEKISTMHTCQILTPHNATRILINKMVQLCRWGADGGLEITFACDFPDAPRGTNGVAHVVDGGMIAIEGDGGVRFRGTAIAAVKLVNASVNRGGVATEGAMAIRPGDKIIVTKNTPDGTACNGDVGIMTTATPFSATVSLSHGLTVRLEAETSGTFAGQLTLAYATTVHKAQGSEFSHVVLPVTNHSAWDRTLLYTACTRARDRLYILGTLHALEAIVQNVRPTKPSSFCEALRRNACGSR